VTRESGFDSQREEMFLSSRPSKPVLVFTQAPVQYVLGLKRPELEADNTNSQSSAHAKGSCGAHVLKACKNCMF